MGSTTSKLVMLAALLQLLVAIPVLTRAPETGSYLSVIGIEGGLIAHWAFNIQTALWPAIYLLALAIGLEVLRRVADALEQAAIDEER
jgi:hypothetical protein